VLRSRICRNHPFPDGNERVAFLAMRLFACPNGATWDPPDDAGPVIEFLAAGVMAEDDFAEWVRSRWRSDTDPDSPAFS
jgi:death-on-curing protein